MEKKKVQEKNEIVESNQFLQEKPLETMLVLWPLLSTRDTLRAGKLTEMCSAPLPGSRSWQGAPREL